MSGKRTHGSGSVEQLPSGRWRFKLTSADGKRRASPSYDSRAECEAVLAAALEELAAGNMAPIGAVTLGAYAERFLARLTTRTADEDRSRWRRHLEGSELASMPLVDIKRRNIRDFLAALQATRKLMPTSGQGAKSGGKAEGRQTIGAQTQKHVLGLLRRVLNDARSDDLIEVNPCEGVKVARAEDTSEEKWSFLSLEEIERLLRCPKLPEDKRLIYEVAIYTGMRQGELWALRWRDVDLDSEHPSCTCRRSYRRATKANKVRHFPLLPAAVAALGRVRELAADTGPDALVFPGKNGEMFGEGYDAGWERWKERAGLRPELRFHDLRHTCASHLAMGSWGRAWTIAEIRDFIGHSSVSMTERYAHLGPGHLKALAAATKIVHGSSTPAPAPQPAIVAGEEKTEEKSGELLSRGSQVRFLPGALLVRGGACRSLWAQARCPSRSCCACVPTSPGRAGQALPGSGAWDKRKGR